MWFEFPTGTDKISVQLHEYGVEAEENGRQFFRAPDHFAAIILDLPGFKSVSKPPTGAPPDLPKVDPVRDVTIGKLGGQVDALKMENENLRAALTEQKVLYDDLRVKYNETLTELNNLKAENLPGVPDQELSTGSVEVLDKSLPKYRR